MSIKQRPAAEQSGRCEEILLLNWHWASGTLYFPLNHPRAPVKWGTTVGFSSGPITSLDHGRPQHASPRACLAEGAFRKQADFTSEVISVPGRSSVNARLEQMDEVTWRVSNAMHGDETNILTSRAKSSSPPGLVCPAPPVS